MTDEVVRIRREASTATKQSQGRLTSAIRRRWAAILVTAAVLAAVGIGLAAIGARRVPTPRLPKIDLTGAASEKAKAILAAEDVVNRNPRSAKAWGQLAMILHANGFVPPAADCYVAADQLDPRDPEWCYLHGILLQTLGGGPDAAAPYYRLAASRSTPNSMARIRLAEMLLELDRLEEAAIEYRTAASADPEDGYALFGLAKVAFARNQLPDSLRILQALSDNPLVRKRSCALRISVLERLGDRAAADVERGRLVGIPADVWRPDDPINHVLQLEVGDRIHLQEAEVLLQQKRYDELIVLLQDIVRQYPQSDKAWAALGDSWVILREPDAAEIALRKSIALAPNEAAYRFSLGMLQLSQERYQEAAETFRKIIELRAHDGSAHFQLGESLRALGDLDGAAAAYRESLRFVPDFAPARQRLDSILKEQ